MDGNNRSEDVYIEGRPAPPPGSNVNLSSWVRVSPDYFTTIGTKLLAGRVFSDSDNRNSANVAIVDEAFVKKYLGGQTRGTHPLFRTTFGPHYFSNGMLRPSAIVASRAYC
jgi:hypothetical protein